MTEDQTPDDLEQLKSDAIESRQRLADDIDALGAKLSPSNLKKEAKEAVNDLGRMAVSEVQSVAMKAATRTQKLSVRFIRVVRENPVSAVFIGAALGWLIYRATVRRRPPRMQDEL